MNIAKTMQRAFRLHNEFRRYEEAEALYRRALRVDMNNPEIMRLLGLCIAQQGRPEEGERYLREAQAAAPKDPQILANLASVVGALGDHKAAWGLADRAIEIMPGFPNAMFTRGIARLSLGDWVGGWADYEAGFDSGDRPRRMIRGERWRGGPLPSGSTLVLWYEQGYGDTLMAARFVREAKTWAGPGVKIIVEVQDALKGILFGLEGADAVVSEKDTLPPFRYHASLMSLPYLFGLTPKRAAELWKRPYIVASPIRASRYEEAVRKIGGIPVGFCTQGNKAHVNDRNRSVHDFSEMLPLVGGDCLPAKFHSLNYGPGQSQHDFDTFDDLVALMSHMKLIITIDSAVAHLAGAMGKPCWLMLPSVGCDFRWMPGAIDEEGQTRTCWYPSVELTKQVDREGGWLPVTAVLAERLRGLLSESVG